MLSLFGNKKAGLLINDPPYNIKVGSANTKALSKVMPLDYLEFSRRWIGLSDRMSKKNSSLYIWIGADQRDGFQPLPEIIGLMREHKTFRSRSMITLRNQRGYGTQKNWMSVRQELLYYIKGSPEFNVVYTDIPKVLKGYYKEVGGVRTENIERSRSENIRPGNVWMDIQQVFYRMEENVPGAYAQKPIKAIERIILASSLKGDLIGDFFSHSGTTLLAAERLKRKCYTCDIDPVFAELTIRRLERYRATGKTGWQWQNPFPELENHN
jgi:site-specific DNA-methyltransferase (adenine-specific)